MVPHVVGQIEDPVAHIASEIGIYERSGFEINEASHWDSVIQGMVEVVHGSRGTARRSAFGATYRYAGKTGTAQLFGIAQNQTADNDKTPKHLRDHALFIAFAPVENPEIAVAVVIENGGSGSRVAAPVARVILDYYFNGTAETTLDDG